MEVYCTIHTVYTSIQKQLPRINTFLGFASLFAFPGDITDFRDELSSPPPGCLHVWLIKVLSTIKAKS